MHPLLRTCALLTGVRAPLPGFSYVYYVDQSGRAQVLTIADARAGSVRPVTVEA